MSLYDHRHTLARVVKIYNVQQFVVFLPSIDINRDARWRSSFKNEAEVSRCRNESSFVGTLSLIFKPSVLVFGHDGVTECEESEEVVCMRFLRSDGSDEFPVVPFKSPLVVRIEGEINRF